jgi:hypothetical protein
MAVKNTHKQVFFALLPVFLQLYNQKKSRSFHPGTFNYQKTKTIISFV